MLSTELPATVANLTKPRRYISVTETAKLVRQALKEAFPEVKFSVKSSSYSGGASIRVRWTGGPVVAQVSPIAKAFEGSSFDGMIDLKSNVDNTIDGEPVSFGADFVFVDRDQEDDKVAAVQAILEKAGKDYWLTFASRMGIKSCEICNCYDASEAAAYLERNTKPAAFEGRRSKLADSITCLGTR